MHSIKHIWTRTPQGGATDCPEGFSRYTVNNTQPLADLYSMITKPRLYKRHCSFISVPWYRKRFRALNSTSKRFSIENRRFTCDGDDLGIPRFRSDILSSYYWLLSDLIMIGQTASSSNGIWTGFLWSSMKHTLILKYLFLCSI